MPTRNPAIKTPEVKKPEVKKPEMKKPEMKKPEMKKPVAKKSMSKKPVASKVIYPEKITFSTPQDIEVYGEEYISPYISLVGKGIDLVENLNEIVAPEHIIIRIDYPIDNPAEVVIVEPKPMTRKKLIQNIIRSYKKIYKNKKEFGIYDHDFEDLADLGLHAVVHTKNKTINKIKYNYYVLYIDS